MFCASLADVFDNAAPEQWRFDLLNLIADTPHLDWLLLTKRIGNARAMLDAFCGSDGNVGEAWSAWPNVWLGATICNQEEADRDIPKLLAAPAAKRFLSIEPMLGPVAVPKLCDSGSVPGPGGVGGVTCSRCDGTQRYGCLGVDWVICGGESGPHARPIHPDWVRSLRDQCASAGVPFHFKQWGEWWEVNSDGRDEETGDHEIVDVPSIEATERFDPKTDRLIAYDGTVYVALDELPYNTRCRHMTRLGTKAAGRLLDGRTHDEHPA